MGDEQVSHAELGAQVKHLALDGHVQREDRLVQDEHLRAAPRGGRAGSPVPAMATVPPVGRSRPAMILATVVFPEPDSPP